MWQSGDRSLEGPQRTLVFTLGQTRSHHGVPAAEGCGLLTGSRLTRSDSVWFCCCREGVLRRAYVALCCGMFSSWNLSEMLLLPGMAEPGTSVRLQKALVVRESQDVSRGTHCPFINCLGPLVSGGG